MSNQSMTIVQVGEGEPEKSAQFGKSDRHFNNGDGSDDDDVVQGPRGGHLVVLSRKRPQSSRGHCSRQRPALGHRHHHAAFMYCGMVCLLYRTSMSQI